MNDPLPPPSPRRPGATPSQQPINILVDDDDARGRSPSHRSASSSVVMSPAQRASALLAACDTLTLLNVEKERVACVKAMATLAALAPRAGELSPDLLRCVLLQVRASTDSKVGTLREVGLRTARYVCGDAASLRLLFALSFGIVLARELEKVTKQLNERVQALKLVRHVVAVAPQVLPRNVAKAVVVVAGDGQDPLRRACLETLRSLTVSNPALVAAVNGFKVVTAAVLDSSLDTPTEPLLMTLMYLANEPATRKFLRPALDIETLLAPLTDFTQMQGAGGKDLKERKAKTRASAKAVATLMKSWTGIMVLTSEPHVGLRAMVDALLLPPQLNDELGLHNEIFDTLGAILQAATPSWAVGGASCLPARHRVHTLLSNYASVVLLALLHVGAVETLSTTGKSGDEEISKRSTELLGRMLMLGSSLLPPTHCAHLYSLAPLVSSASQFSADPLERLHANNMLTDLHLVSRETVNEAQRMVDGGLDDHGVVQMPTPTNLAVANSRLVQPRPSTMLNTQGAATRFHLDLLVAEASKWRRVKGVDMGGGQRELVKRKMDSAMDDAKFNALLLKSSIPLTKDANKWRWDVVLELLEGVLLNTQRLKEVLNTSKFIKRLLSFMRPSKRIFCTMEWSPARMFYVRALCRVMEVLTSCEEGCEYLWGSDVLQQVNKQLEAAVKEESPSSPRGDKPLSAPPSNRRKSSEAYFSESESRGRERGDVMSMFSVGSVAMTMSREYFTILGFLTKTDAGSELMQRSGLLRTILSVATTGRDDLNRLISTGLDYNLEGQPRVFLSQLMTSASKPIRLHCTRHLRVLLRAGVPDFESWGIDLLTTQLRDQDREVVMAALEVLLEACQDGSHLETLIRRRPANLRELGRRGRDLMTQMMRTELGVKYLGELKWIDSEMERWHQRAAVEYALEVEERLIKALNSQQPARSRTPSRLADAILLGEEEDGVALPPHFYGTLASTAVGLEILKESNHVAEFEQCLQAKDTPALRRRAALWALGHVGSSPTGVALLLETNVISDMVKIAVGSQCLSLRGTCCYAVGLISRTRAGRAALAQLNWDSPSSLDAGISLPRHPHDFFSIPGYEFDGSPTNLCPNLPTMPLSNSEADAFKAVANLCNSVTRKAAQNALHAMKQAHHPCLHSPRLFLQVQEMLCHYNFGPNSRKYVYELFSGVRVADLDALPPPSFVEAEE